MIFFFTGTGNSLYAARSIGSSIGDEDIRSIPAEMRRRFSAQDADTSLASFASLASSSASDSPSKAVPPASAASPDPHTTNDAPSPANYAESYHAECIGLVCPIYGHDLPAMVKGFLACARFTTEYFFIVLTYGNRHANAIELACDQADKAGIDVAYAATLLMVDNWLPGYDIAEQLSTEKDIDAQIARISEDVSRRSRFIEPVVEEDRLAHERLLSYGISFTPEGSRDLLAFDGPCIACGLCTRVCPSGCIAIDAREGRARRDPLAGLGCNVCLACIHACPAHAIRMPMGDKNPQARFLNERVSRDEIIRANGGSSA